MKKEKKITLHKIYNFMCMWKLKCDFQKYRFDWERLFSAVWKDLNKYWYLIGNVKKYFIEC